MSASIVFKKAVKLNAKLRLAACGPAGSGKTYTLIQLACMLAAMAGGRAAVVDTEHGSASKYADKFDFDGIEPDNFDPRQLIETIDAAVEAGYKAMVIDSLSHYWMGKGGELDMVDNAARRQDGREGNSFAAWKHVTPVHNALIDKILTAPIHILVSMRTKTEWVIEENSKGKKVPRKIGLAPVMRDGIEFEFDVCGDLDQDNNFTVTKSRCSDLAGLSINRPGREMVDTLAKWLNGAPAPARAAAPAPRTVAPQSAGNDDPPLMGPPVTGPVQLSKTPADVKAYKAQVAAAKREAAAAPRIDEERERLGIVQRETPPTFEQQMIAAFDASTGFEPLALFKQLKETAFPNTFGPAGEDIYYDCLKKHGVQKSNGFTDKAAGRACFRDMLAVLWKENENRRRRELEQGPPPAAPIDDQAPPMTEEEMEAMGVIA